MFSLEMGKQDKDVFLHSDLTFVEKMEAGLPHIFGALTPTIVNEFVTVNSKGIVQDD